MHYCNNCNMYDHDASLAPSARPSPPLLNFWISRKNGYGCV